MSVSASVPVVPTVFRCPPSYYGDKYYPVPKQIFHVTNEEHVPEITHQLHVASGTMDINDTWVGVSLMDNLDKAAVAKVDTLECFDMCENVEGFWNELKSIILITENYEDAQLLTKNLMLKYADCFSINYPKRREGIGPFEILERDIKAGVSWLSNQTFYDHIRKIYLANKMRFTLLNVMDSEQVRLFRTRLTAEKKKIRYLNASNISLWVKDHITFISNLNILKGGDSPFFLTSAPAGRINRPLLSRTIGPLLGSITKRKSDRAKETRIELCNQIRKFTTKQDIAVLKDYDPRFLKFFYEVVTVNCKGRKASGEEARDYYAELGFKFFDEFDYDHFPDFFSQLEKYREANKDALEWVNWVKKHADEMH